MKQYFDFSRPELTGHYSGPDNDRLLPPGWENLGQRDFRNMARTLVPDYSGPRGKDDPYWAEKLLLGMTTPTGGAVTPGNYGGGATLDHWKNAGLQPGGGMGYAQEAIFNNLAKTNPELRDQYLAGMSRNSSNDWQGLLLGGAMLGVGALAAAGAAGAGAGAAGGAGVAGGAGSFAGGAGGGGAIAGEGLLGGAGGGAGIAGGAAGGGALATGAGGLTLQQALQAGQLANNLFNGGGGQGRGGSGGMMPPNIGRDMTPGASIAAVSPYANNMGLHTRPSSWFFRRPYG